MPIASGPAIDIKTRQHNDIKDDIKKQDETRQHKTIQDKTGKDKTRKDKTGQDKTQLYNTSQDKRDKITQDMTIQLDKIDLNHRQD